MESFIKYIDEEIKQNAINALIEVSKVGVSKEKAKRGAKNTSRFLVHWLGLLAKNKFLIILTKKFYAHYKISMIYKPI